MIALMSVGNVRSCVRWRRLYRPNKRDFYLVCHAFACCVICFLSHVLWL